MTADVSKTLDKDIKELIVKLGNELTNRDDIDMLSEIYGLEDQKFSKLLLVDKMLELGTISTWVNTILSLRVSKRRKGRKEIIETIKGIVEKSKEGKGEKTSMAIKKVLLDE